MRRKRDETEREPDEELRKRIGAHVLALRRTNHWTQEQAAHYCDVPLRLFQLIEKCDANVTLITLGRLACGFDVDAAKLLAPATVGRKRKGS